jgi:RNase H-like domain found in reverse transcriptase
MSKLLLGLEFSKACLDDLLVVMKDSFVSHLKPVGEVVTSLASAGLKINALKVISAVMNLNI